MVKVHKRTKNSRIRGSRTAGWGFRQSHKGHGSKGGFGNAGTGKRADHKKQVALESDTKTKKRYFGKQGVTSRGTARDKRVGLNLYDLKDNLFKKDGNKINLPKYKILGSGEGFKAEITALGATELAIKKMSDAGGSIIVLNRDRKNIKQYLKKEKKVEDSEGNAAGEGKEDSKKEKSSDPGKKSEVKKVSKKEVVKEDSE